MRKALALLLALSLPACGVGNGAQGPYIPPASIDMAQPPALEAVQPGPDSSGGDVRLLWVKTAGGARVRLGQKVHAVELSKAVGVPVQCAFEESGVLGQYACAPTGPVVASVLPYFTDSACQSRLYWETPEYRSCISPEPMIGVWYIAAPSSYIGCVNRAVAFRLRRITTPQIIYTNSGGKCVTFQTGTADRNYYTMGADLSSLIPVGTLGVE